MSIEQYMQHLEYYSHRIRNYHILEKNRDRIEKCPSSTKYHGCFPGGLVDHSLSVANIAETLAINTKTYNVFIESLTFCALVHDLGKLGSLDEDFYLTNPDEQKREKEPYIVNTKLVSMPHELRTLYWLEKIGVNDLTEAEYQAIFYHAGPYTPGYLDCVKGESPLLILLHSADNISTKVLEARP
jgi:HD superfamily phosphohydrolase YqeK